MKKKFSLALVPLLLLLIVPVVLVTGCEREAPEGEVQDDRDRAEIDRGESLEDASLTAKVKTRLARDERLGAPALEDIDVETREGVVTLKGAVDREKSRTAAEEIARAMDGVAGVVNQITVGRGESSAT